MVPQFYSILFNDNFLKIVNDKSRVRPNFGIYEKVIQGKGGKGLSKDDFTNKTYFVKVVNQGGGQKYLKVNIFYNN